MRKSDASIPKKNNNQTRCAKRKRNHSYGVAEKLHAHSKDKPPTRGKHTHRQGTAQTTHKQQRCVYMRVANACARSRTASGSPQHATYECGRRRERTSACFNNRHTNPSQTRARCASALTIPGSSVVAKCAPPSSLFFVWHMCIEYVCICVYAFGCKLLLLLQANAWCHGQMSMLLSSSSRWWCFDNGKFVVPNMARMYTTNAIYEFDVVWQLNWGSVR